MKYETNQHSSLHPNAHTEWRYVDAQDDNRWKEKMVDEEKLKSVKPEEIKQDQVLSDIWGNFTNEAVSRRMLYKD